MLSIRLPTLQVAWSVLLVCLALVTPSLADSAEAGFNFTYGYKTAANTVSAVDYSDEAGTSLRVRVAVFLLPGIACCRR